ncbi:EF-hand domain-containing protein [Pendulispora albinea]|uniref:EF-hand domain-containing protein n=1 Tax=Pendulispora albinea TaxID=2741071 RepID=A0ABZ2MBA7_9BACT
MGISAFLERKLAKRFETFDTNGDGAIERVDFELSVERMGRAFGLDADDARLQRLRALSLGLWEHLASAADRDGDGRIDLAEYEEAFVTGLLETPESFDQGYVPFLEAIFAIADTDGDGRLDVAEHIRWTGSLMNLPEADARDIHRRLDRDGDGYIASRDLLDAIREFYFDEHPESAGSWLLGKLKG